MKFHLAEGDAESLLRAYAALHEGKGTWMPLTSEMFLKGWAENARTFVGPSGFIGFSGEPLTEIVLAPFDESFAENAKGLIRQVFPVYKPVVLAAATGTPAGDKLVEAIGFRYDGVMRRRAVTMNGGPPEYRDLCLWSIVPEEVNKDG